MKPMSDLNVMERYAVAHLRRWSDREEPHIHRWSQADLAKIRRTERRKIALACLTGVMSGTIIGGAEIGLRGWLVEEGAAGWGQTLLYWSVFMGLAIAVSGVEILFLYWNVLRVAARLGSIAGLRFSDQELDHVIAVGLSRGALEVPNPREPIFGIDPYANVPRWKLVAYAVLYRLKIGATSFILRVLARRILARAAVRFFIPLLAAPVYSAWNGIITWWVMRDVRLRIAGPVAVQELGEWLAAEATDLDEATRRRIVEVAGEAIVLREDAHPNFVLLLARLFDVLGVAPDSIDVDPERNRAALGRMDRREQDLVLTTAMAASVLAGRPRKAHRALLKELHEACGRSFHPQALSQWFEALFEGQGMKKAERPQQLLLFKL